MTYKEAAEGFDRLVAAPRFFIGFNIAVIALLLVSIDTANIFISIITAGAVILRNGSQRRFERAVHAKLDELVEAIPEARAELERAEDRCEEEIEQLRR